MLLKRDSYLLWILAIWLFFMTRSKQKHNSPRPRVKWTNIGVNHSASIVFFWFYLYVSSSPSSFTGFWYIVELGSRFFPVLWMNKKAWGLPPGVLLKHSSRGLKREWDSSKKSTVTRSTGVWQIRYLSHDTSKCHPPKKHKITDLMEHSSESVWDSSS